jgi:uncharacterized protein YndB with AHSA1/START domain
MTDILHDLPIRASAAAVFDMATVPAKLDEWWTMTSGGQPDVGSTYRLFFGDAYDWRARVAACDPGKHFELELTDALPDWIGTRVSFTLEESGNLTLLRFAHTGWADTTEHYRVSNCCWAMYLRILRRHLEHGERVPYDRRLDV